MNPSSDAVSSLSLRAEPATVDLPGVPERRNPWFVLSGLCMLGGCALVSVGAHGRKDEVAPVVAVVLTVMLYQALVASLAIWLARTGRSRRDAGVLAVLLTLLAADTTLLVGELVTAAPAWGVTLGLAGLGASAAELWWVLTALGVSCRGVGGVIAGWNLALAVALPTVFRFVAGDGFLPEVVLYAGAWAVAAALLASVAWCVLDRATLTAGGGAGVSESARPLLHAVILLPVASQVLHLWAGTYTYGIDVEPTLVSPLLIGGAAAVAMLGRGGATLPIAGLLMLLGLACVGEPAWWPVGHGATAWRLSLLGAAAAVVQVGVVRRSWLVGGLAWLPVAAALLGEGADDAGKVIHTTSTGTGGLIARAVRWAVPDTLVGWGGYAVTLAFVLLAVGACIAQRRGRDAAAVEPFDTAR